MQNIGSFWSSSISIEPFSYLMLFRSSLSQSWRPSQLQPSPDEINDQSYHIVKKNMACWRLQLLNLVMIWANEGKCSFTVNFLPPTSCSKDFTCSESFYNAFSCDRGANSIRTVSLSARYCRSPIT